MTCFARELEGQDSPLIAHQDRAPCCDTGTKIFLGGVFGLNLLTVSVAGILQDVDPDVAQTAWKTAAYTGYASIFAVVALFAGKQCKKEYNDPEHFSPTKGGGLGALVNF